MSPIRRELLNGMFVLVLASLLSAALEAFQVNFNVQVWVLILLGIAVAAGGYMVFEFVRSAETREIEWLKRVGNPARLELGLSGDPYGASVVEAIKAMRPASDLTIVVYLPEGDRVAGALREEVFHTILEQLERGTIREYKRLLCFEHNVLANDHELKSGILRVGEGPGTITRHMGEHCRLMMEIKGCSLYVAPVVFRPYVVLYGTEKASMTVETVDPDTEARTIGGLLIFGDPPNGEIIEQLRQIERAAERRMVAVHEIRFPEDAVPTGKQSTR